MLEISCGDGHTINTASIGKKQDVTIFPIGSTGVARLFFRATY
jgi:hypothetical protein